MPAAHFAREAGEHRESLQWRHRIRIDCTQLLDRRIRYVRKQGELVGGWRARTCRRGTKRAPALERRHELLALEQCQDFARPLYHRRGETGQSPDLHPVRTVCPTRLQTMEEQHLVADFPHTDVIVSYCYQFLRELHQLVIVRREYRLAPGAVVEVLAHRPGDGYAIVGRRATANLIQQHQARRRRRMENGAGLGHLHHEGGLATHEVVARAYAREYPVADSDACAFSRHEAAHL